MKPKVHYAPVAEAIEKLRAQGFTIDFTLKGKELSYAEGNLNINDFEIADVYRYEGDSDPGDEAVVYALQSKSGLKGVLVTGYGASSDTAGFEALAKLMDDEK